MLCELQPAGGLGISSLQISPDQLTLCSTSLDGTATLWDLHTQQQIATLKHHTDAVNCSLFTNDKQVMTGGDDRLVVTWDARDLSKPFHVLTGFHDGVNKMCLGASTPTLYTAADDGIVYVHGLREGLPLELRFMVSEATANDITCIAGNPDIVLTCSEDHAIRSWKTGPVRQAEEGGDDRLLDSLDAFENPVNHILLVGQKRLYAASSECAVLLPFDPETGHFGDAETAIGFVGHSDYIRGLEVAGDRLFTVSDDQTLIEWNAATGEMIRRVKLHNDMIMGMALVRDPANREQPTHLVSGCEDGSIRVWNLPFATEEV